MNRRKILLVGWDAADWKVIRPLLDAGRMPSVRRIVKEGVAGQIATLHPPLSPMLWTSIATGKRPFKHGIHGFSEPAPDGLGVRPVSNLSRKSKAVWNILNQNGLRSIVIGWWPSHPAEPIDGVMVSDHYHRAAGPVEEAWPLRPNTVHPAELAGTLAGLRVHPDLLSPAMVEPFIPLAHEIDQENDKRLAAFLRTLAECMSIQSAAKWLIENQPWDLFAVYFDSIDHFSHGFMRYHPPRQSWIAERDFELYGNVVAKAYELHDRMLGELLEKAGADATVILMSDHGFHPDHLRAAAIPDIPAGPAVEHRDFGIVAMRGPGIKRGKPLHGSSVLDIAPTILALNGLAVGEDMDGKVLSEAFNEPPRVSFIPSWEDINGRDGRHPPHTQIDPVAAQEALDQMIALGYIEPPDENREIAVKRTVRELRYNLGESYQDAGRHREALEIFRELYAADPDEQRFAVRLFVSLQALGMTEEMRRVVDDLDGRRRALYEEARGKIAPLSDDLDEDQLRELARWKNLARFQPAVADYLKAQVWIEEKRYADALAALEAVRDATRARPGILVEIGDVHARMRRWSDAQRAYESALAIDPDYAGAYIGVARIELQRRKFAKAAHTALNALERVYQDPLAHFVLGCALSGMEQDDRAAEAFRAAISFNPNFPQAHVRLAALLERSGHQKAAREHRRLARSMNHVAPIALPNPGPRPVRAALQAPAPDWNLPAIAESVVIVSGLPRSGTSMLMQMLAAGGMPVLSDARRRSDEDNPHGYLELQRVKSLWKDSAWLSEARGCAVKIVAPLLKALPDGLACRVILCERDLDEVLDSQDRMLARRSEPATPPERRQRLKEEYARTLDRVIRMLAHRPRTGLLRIEHRCAISSPSVVAQSVNRFLGENLDVTKMAAAIDPALYRNRSGTSKLSANH
jgi:tetratricopeptide (TPR) repeat protein